MNNEITVTIPAQEYSSDKYIGCDDQLCYLEEALVKAGYENVHVSSYGWTTINNNNFKPKNVFNCISVREAFDKKESITVTLIPI